MKLCILKHAAVGKSGFNVLKACVLLTDSGLVLVSTVFVCSLNTYPDMQKTCTLTMSQECCKAGIFVFKS